MNPVLLLLLSVLCPIAVALSFPKANVTAFAFVGLAPLFWSWSQASWKAAFWSGWLAGSILFGIVLYWMTHSIGDFVGNWTPVALVLLAAMQGLFVGAAALLTALCCRGRYGALAVAAAPAAWVVAEMLRSLGALGMPFGDLGLVAVHVPWLLPMAAFGGVFGVSAIIALVNGALAGIAASQGGARRAGTAALVALALIVVIGDAARARVLVEPPHLKVAIAQGNISQRAKWSPAVFGHTLQTYAALTRTAADRGARLVVWPETAITSFPLQDAALLRVLETLAQSSHEWILAGTIDRVGAGAYHNVVIALSPQGALSGVYVKHLLVPFAEYLPLDRYLRRVALLAHASQFTAGDGPKILAASGAAFGTLICYESAFPPYARRTANAGADTILVVTDDAWFGHTAGPYQHLDMSVIDAVQTGRWVVRGADTGVSAIIDPKGNVIQSLPLDQTGVIVGDIGPPIGAPYLRLGSFWLIALAGVAVLAALAESAGRRGGQAAGWRSKRGRS
ncbi:MAG: apolipoprotein N-acyltransferase [Candidatus Eremiobacteraeota bacterium]|nr:apolipoprotein N-acyltransferase [Candidatus Eremiobacteraeota bacterium]